MTTLPSADRRAIDRTLGRFVEDGMGRRDLAAAYRLASPALRGGLTLRAMVPNAITAAALCVGLTGIRFAIAGDFERSVQMVILAGVLDGIDGRAARLLKAK